VVWCLQHRDFVRLDFGSSGFVRAEAIAEAVVGKAGS